MAVARGTEAEGVAQVAAGADPMAGDDVGAGERAGRPVRALLRLAVPGAGDVTTVTDSVEAHDLAKQLIGLTLVALCGSNRHTNSLDDKCPPPK